MKLINYLLLSSIIALGTACDETVGKEDPTLTVVPAGIIMLPAEGGTKTFEVKTNQKDWSVVSNKSWCAISNKTATEFTIEVGKNPFVTLRDTAVLTLQAGEAQAIEIGISQWVGTAELSISPVVSELDYPAEISSESNTFTVTSNEKNWQAKVLTADSVWCNVSMNKEANTFTIKPLTNSLNTARSATVRVSGVIAKSINITVRQKARSSHSTDDYEYEKGTGWD